MALVITQYRPSQGKKKSVEKEGKKKRGIHLKPSSQYRQDGPCSQHPIGSRSRLGYFVFFFPRLGYASLREACSPDDFENYPTRK